MCAAHKRPNQDAALQILLKDSVAVGDGPIKPLEFPPQPSQEA